MDKEFAGIAAIIAVLLVAGFDPNEIIAITRRNVAWIQMNQEIEPIFWLTTKGMRCVLTRRGEDGTRNVNKNKVIEGFMNQK